MFAQKVTIVSPAVGLQKFEREFAQLALVLQEEMWQHIRIRPNPEGACIEIIGDNVFARLRLYEEAGNFTRVNVRSRLHRHARFDTFFLDTFKGLEVHITQFEPYFASR